MYHILYSISLQKYIGYVWRGIKTIPRPQEFYRNGTAHPGYEILRSTTERYDITKAWLLKQLMHCAVDLHPFVAMVMISCDYKPRGWWKKINNLNWDLYQQLRFWFNFDNWYQRSVCPHLISLICQTHLHLCDTKNMCTIK